MKRLGAILASLPESMPVLTVNIPVGRQHPFSAYDRATNHESHGENVVRFPKRKIGEKQRDLTAMLSCSVNEFGDVEYSGDEYA